ncbi:MAG: hypothetical protein AABY39_06170 [Nitrospirota bacterium]
MKKIIVLIAVFILAVAAYSEAIAQEKIAGQPVTVNPAMSKGPENAPVTIHEFSSYQ